MKTVMRVGTPEVPLLTANEDGEIIDLVLPKGSRFKVEVPTDDVVLNKFTDYVSSDTELEEELLWILSASDYRRYRLMACKLHTKFNVVLSGNNRPHTLQSLAEAIRLSVDETTRFVKRLAKKGLLVHCVCPESGHDDKIYMLNPHVIRKRKTVHKQVLTLFPYFRKIGGPIKAKKKAPSKRQLPTE